MPDNEEGVSLEDYLSAMEDFVSKRLKDIKELSLLIIRFENADMSDLLKNPEGTFSEAFKLLSDAYTNLNICIEFYEKLTKHTKDYCYEKDGKYFVDVPKLKGKENNIPNIYS